MNDSAAAADSTPAVDLGALQVAVIGAGNMGGPVVRTMLEAGVSPQHLRIANSSTASSERAASELGASAASTRSEALEGADVVVLGVKPYQILDVVTELRDELPAGAVVISWPRASLSRRSSRRCLQASRWCGRCRTLRSRWGRELWV
ncbi:pyrroline-5-carboxylate reductase [Brachybacterium sp. Z12]|uniref:pyrroline-5-carboxylate reductase family protein n=1 Tax=Brachybacterium sp. Z12 TaxID=2759167 RepID=UPI00223BD9B7|nr:NAD(P)-binding domain-containing protein [Brachybacterium sp. Z12]